KLFASLMLAALSLASFAGENPASEEASKPWRSGWFAHWNDPSGDDMIAAAKDLEFNALVVGGSFTPERMQEFSLKAKKEGIDAYLWFFPMLPKDQDKDKFMQVMPEKDVKLLEKCKANKEWKKTLQGGGEPLPGYEEVHRKPLPCFHRKEVMDAMKDAIREMIEKCPAMAGIAFDGFAYQNFRNCVCEESLRQLGEFRKNNPSLSPEVSEEKFALESLVGAINELANFARSLRPEIKTTIHVWPTYLPEPLYGNRLDLDYCAQTVAWFYQPYWSDEKIASYTRTVVQDEKKYFKRAKGIPFMGIYLGKKHTIDKPLDQFKKELKIIFENSYDTSFSVHEIADIAFNPEYRKAFKEAVQQKK
ncbi:MAG TPA: hypothetical protein PK821_00830, partial [Victivallales bacterium]|nr:hypothetical protein [Victivallales bacterium]